MPMETLPPDFETLVRRVKANLRVSKIIATRTVRGPKGDTQAGFIAELSTSEVDGEESMTLREAIVANCLLAREADIAAYRNAVAGGNLSFEAGRDAIQSVKNSYAKVLAEALAEAGET
jgi:hypothetical protein